MTIQQLILLIDTVGGGEKMAEFIPEEPPQKNLVWNPVELRHRDPGVVIHFTGDGLPDFIDLRNRYACSRILCKEALLQIQFCFWGYLGWAWVSF
jgi:hypothetical protein